MHLAEGTIELAVPQVRNTIEPFESVWLQALGKRSARLFELIPMLYVKGMSQRDVEAALIEALGVEDTGRSVISQVCRGLRGEFERWQDRDLSGYRLITCSSTASTCACVPRTHGRLRCCAPMGCSGTAGRSSCISPSAIRRVPPAGRHSWRR